MSHHISELRLGVNKTFEMYKYLVDFSSFFVPNYVSVSDYKPDVYNTRFAAKVRNITANVYTELPSPGNIANIPILRWILNLNSEICVFPAITSCKSRQQRRTFLRKADATEHIHYPTYSRQTNPTKIVQNFTDTTPPVKTRHINSYLSFGSDKIRFLSVPIDICRKQPLSLLWAR